MQIYLTDARGLWDLPGIDLIAEPRRSRLFKYKRQSDRALCLAAGLLLKYALNIGDDDFKYNNYGKPYADNAKHFNLAHGGNYAALAAGDSELGVDIEQISEFDYNTAKRVCTKEELEHILKSRAKEEEFYSLWTKKESVLKAEGSGLSLSPRSICALNDNEPCFALDSCFYLYQYKYDDHMICAASVSKERPSLNVISREELLDVIT